MKKTITIALAYVGILVGAGFASGQEIIQFFVSFGYWGLGGALLAGLIMTLTGAAILQLGSYFQSSEHLALFAKVTNPWVARFLDLCTVVTLFFTGVVMIAGAGANLNQQFDLPVWAGAVIMIVVIMATGMLDVDKVSQIIGGITPFIIIFIIIASVYSILNAPTDIAELNSINDVATSIDSTAPNWVVSSFSYVGLSFMMGVSMAIVIAGSQLMPKEAGRGGLFGGLLFGLLLIVAAASLFLQIKTVKDADMPMLSLVTNINPTLGLIMSFVIFAMIFNTCLGLFYSLGKRSTANNPSQFRVVYIATILIAFGLSFIGFGWLVNNLYPILGYVGIVLIFVVLYAWWKARHSIKEESERRDSIRDLAYQKVDSTQNFTDTQARELKHLAQSSNLDTQDLEESLRNDLDKEDALREELKKVGSITGEFEAVTPEMLEQQDDD